MFTPEYLNDLVEATHAAATEFNMYLTNKVIDSVIGLFEYNGKIEIAPSNKHRIRLLRQSGILVSDIEREINKRLPGLDKKVREAFYQAGYDINNEINKSVSDMVESDKEMKDFVGKAPRLENLTEEEKRILDAAYKRTKGEIKNLTRTTAADINTQFHNSCDAAYWKATHGVDATTAIREAIDEVSKYGSHVVYRNHGKERKMTVEAAVRMCVLTGVNQANGEITLTTCADMGIKNVLVSSHLGARYTDKAEPANHQSWQGQVYTLSDDLLKRFGYAEKPQKKNVFAKIKDFFGRFRKQKVYPDFEAVTGYGTIEGLCGINCRHTFFLHDPKHNINDQPQYTDEENKKAYDISQKKRYYERKIRETKKLLFEARHAVKAANDEGLKEQLKERAAEIRARFDQQNAEYTAFCQANKVRRSEDRLYVADKLPIMGKGTDMRGAGRIQSIGNESSVKNFIEKAGDSGIMKETDDKGKADVHIVGKIDKKIYSCITDDIVTDEVIITDERIAHIKERHPDNYEMFMKYIPNIISDPEYIIEAGKPNTAVILKEIEENGKKFKVILRIKVKTDPKNYQNSILSFWYIGETTWRKNLKNKKILYSRE